MQDMLDIFIRKFVLCEACDNPETVLKVNNKRGILSASCKACGHSFTLDMRHKLTTFILKVRFLMKKNRYIEFTIFFLSESSGSEIECPRNLAYREKGQEKQT